MVITKKERKRLLRFETAGGVFTAAAATLLHFLYEWSGSELFTALFSSVNESVWEHIKIFSVPYVVWAFVEIFCVNIPFKRLACAKVAGLYAMIISIPVFFYTYTGIFGDNIAIIDILSGYFITVLSYYVSYRLAAYSQCIEKYFPAAVLLFALYCTGLAFFTFAPPKIALFRDPISGGYGISKETLIKSSAYIAQSDFEANWLKIPQ